MNRVIYLVLLLTLSTCLNAKSLLEEQIPEPLKPWVSWVSKEIPERDCPFLHNNYDQKRCSWSSELSLNVVPNQSKFVATWQIYKESWVNLPGDTQHWAVNVTVDNKPALIIEKNGRPAIKLASGFHQIKGDFLWEKLPDNLTIPAETGLINLQINGKIIFAPVIKNGQLWLTENDTKQVKTENIQNRVDVQVFRKILDTTPMQLTTRLLLEVSGEQQEIKLPQVLLSDFIPMQLTSLLPARLENDGTLVVQVRPGHWQLEIVARSEKYLNSLVLQKDKPSEIWVFEAQPDLRSVEIESPGTIDTNQTNLSADWKYLPAYKMTAENAMIFKEISRGNVNPEPNKLTINRKLWLDFDGTGYSVNDVITGKMTRGWRLNTLPETQLGKVTLDGNSQLITQETATKKEGVEVRNGQITLNADSRINGDINKIIAVGWEQTFHSVEAELNLPPGWSLLAATGVDNVPNSWIARWTLLDLFLVLITALATARLWNYYWGVLALITLVVSWHEPEAPHYIWLNILAATALLRVLPTNKFAALTRLYLNGCYLTLILIALPFMVSQIRIGLYPQLAGIEQQEIYNPAQIANDVVQNLPASAPVAAMRGMAMKKEMSIYDSDGGANYAIEEKTKSHVDFERTDPKAKIQTGVGMPQWQWNKITLYWNGAVDSNQQLNLWYLSPTVSMFLNFLRVILITLLALLMCNVMQRFKFRTFHFGNSSMSIIVALTLLTPFQNVFADFPNETLLNELKARVQKVELPDCLPSCATIQQMHLAINDKELVITLEIDTLESVALPLPSKYGQWFPNTVNVDNEAAKGLLRFNDTLWVNLSQGKHSVILRGLTPLLSKFTLPLPLKPKYVAVQKTGWELDGLQENGLADEQLQFTKILNADTKTKPSLEPEPLPPFVRVERTLQLGLDWQVKTKIVRLSPPDSAIFLNIPLLQGESVTSTGIRVKDNFVTVNMAAQQTLMQWESALEKTDKITLVAPSINQWVEVWKADISPIWHLEMDGIPMILGDTNNRFLPEWHPWNDEKVVINVSRPQGVEGKTLTIDNSTLHVTQSQRTREIVLTFNLRSSQGSQHSIVLPEKSLLQTVVINGQNRPLHLEGQKLTLPINPGNQEITVTWQESTPASTKISTSPVNLGQDSVNTNLSLRLGQDRWLIFATGSKFGPVILFWGQIVVIIIVSLGLGKITLTPIKNWQWFLLLLGLSQVPLESAILVVAWFITLGWRLVKFNERSRYFNVLQVSIVMLTFISLTILFAAVAQGLLNVPDMRVTGNNSTAYTLNWYFDRSHAELPIVSAISFPLITYRLLMLAWSLWLAISLLNWMKWGWGCFSSQGLWYKKPKI
jgi:hypothetical protein